MLLSITSYRLQYKSYAAMIYPSSQLKIRTTRDGGIAGIVVVDVAISVDIPHIVPIVAIGRRKESEVVYSHAGLVIHVFKKHHIHIITKFTLCF